MTKTIWKFTLHLNGGIQPVNMPKGATIRHVAGQTNTIGLWAEVDEDAEREDRVFSVFGTGWELPKGRNYVGTAFIDAFVWHVFEVVK